MRNIVKLLLVPNLRIFIAKNQTNFTSGYVHGRGGNCASFGIMSGVDLH